MQDGIQESLLSFYIQKGRHWTKDANPFHIVGQSIGLIIRCPMKIILRTYPKYCKLRKKNFTLTGEPLEVEAIHIQVAKK